MKKHQILIPVKTFLRKGRYIFIAVFVLVSFFLFRNAANNLISNDLPKKCDLIFILLGPVPDRAMLTADLYHEGWSSKILMANEFQAGLNAELAKKLQIDKTSDVFRKALLALGVPDSAIEMLPEVAVSTKDEAIILRNYLEMHPEINSVLIATSSFHGKRAMKLFRKSLHLLERDIEIVVPQNKHTVFNREAWWSDRYSATMVAFEYLKLFNYYVSDQFDLK